MSAVVGVVVSDLDRQWITELARLLPECGVTDAAARVGEVEVLVVGNPPGSILRSFPRLRFVQSAWAGPDRLMGADADVPVARMVAPELTEFMSEFVSMAVLMLHRQAPRYRRAQEARRWEPLRAELARGRRVGLLGYGELGRPVASRLAEIGFDVVAWARSPRHEAIPVVAGAEGFREVLRRSEILVNLLPLTARTRHILDRAAFDLMPRGASLVNVGRGAHVVEADLLEALDDGRLSDAVLDVFEAEPLPPDHPFWAHPRVTVFPHVAAPSDAADLAPHVAANIRRFLEGETPHFLV
ncbi:MAG TPA: glyoxylate/hydroxypyruvate reductase A [Acidimicrobiia bacterium]|nr:glyoxylate/hydroxypyruvate reductase A [Acidimicrobiia bacterium]